MNRRGRGVVGGGIALLSCVLLVSCGDRPPTAPGPVFAPGGGGGGPTVMATDPTEAPQGTTLDIRVFGSGYDDGSLATLLRNGAPVPDVVTRATRFVSSSELVATVSIGFLADTGAYDVQVITTRGKKGIGTELFAVKKGEIVLPPGAEVIDLSMGGAVEGGARTISATGWVLGAGVFKPYVGHSWSPAGVYEQVLTDASVWWSTGNNRGDVTGFHDTQGPFVYRADAATGGRPYTVLPLPVPTGSTPGNFIAWDVNDSGLAVGTGQYTPPGGTSNGMYIVAWPAGSSTHVNLPLPAWADPHSLRLARAVNNAGLVVGRAVDVLRNKGGRVTDEVKRAITWQTGRAVDGSFVVAAPVELPWVPGASEQTAYGVNDAGVIVGFFETGGRNYPARWSPVGGGGYMLATLDTWVYDGAMSVDRCGRMAGTFNSANAQQGFIWDGVSVPVLLPGLPGSVSSRVNQSNDAGDAVGFSEFVSGPESVWRPTLWKGFVAPCP